MKTLSMLLSAGLVVLGIASVLTGNTAGLALIILGSLAFLIIAKKTDKITGYDHKHFMNR